MNCVNVFGKNLTRSLALSPSLLIFLLHSNRHEIFLSHFFFRRLVECFGALNVCAKHTHTLICIGYITVTTVQKSRRRQLFDIVELSSIGDCIELNNNGKKTKQISRKFSWAHEMYTANGEWSKLMRAARESRMLVPFFLILSHNIFPTSNPRSVPLLFYVC